ncbi:hypothetical protein K9M79_03010 [Candidatus Woesearchaeota archaeon]|nr:hypothetical protein [Candidatus Woesearchaeota archaeon]
MNEIIKNRKKYCELMQYIRKKEEEIQDIGYDIQRAREEAEEIDEKLRELVENERNN